MTSLKFCNIKYDIEWIALFSSGEQLVAVQSTPLVPYRGRPPRKSLFCYFNDSKPSDRCKQYLKMYQGRIKRQIIRYHYLQRPKRTWPRERIPRLPHKLNRSLLQHTTFCDSKNVLIFQLLCSLKPQRELKLCPKRCRHAHFIWYLSL